MLLRGFLSKQFQETRTFTLGVPEMMCADNSCAVVLITMGVLLGRMTPVQFLLLAFFETSLAVLVDHVIVNILHVTAALVGKKKNVMEMDEQGSIHHSDLFSMIGTLLLWVFFPSFNAAVQEPEDARHRAIMNTYLAMASGTVTTFILSSFVDNLGRFNMIHIQSSTLSGGVAIGSAANAVLYPSHAVAVGICASFVSVIGHAWLSPKLEKRFKLFDTCGVHNLHGIPGILAG
ncbi:ammonium transporter, partial [Ostertagia ostertagi]